MARAKLNLQPSAYADRVTGEVSPPTANMKQRLFKLPLLILLGVGLLTAVAHAREWTIIRAILPIALAAASFLLTLRKLEILYLRDFIFLLPVSWLISPTLISLFVRGMLSSPRLGWLYSFIWEINLRVSSFLAEVLGYLVFFIPNFILHYLSIFAAWVIISSVVDPLLRWRPIQLAPNRFSTLKRNRWCQNVNIGLALSGGGYRAALMHAGVLAAAEYYGVRVSHVSSVSGGSIIGAFYAAGGSPQAFLETMVKGGLDLKRELFHLQNLHKLIFRRSRVQEELLDKMFFRGMTLDQLSKGESPKIILCTTDLYSGIGVGVGPTFAINRWLPEAWDKRLYSNYPARPSFFTAEHVEYLPGFAATQRVAKIVAASGAFPLAFDAVPVTLRHYVYDTKVEDPYLLSDGGIFDNTGLDILLEAHRESGDAVPPRRSYEGGAWRMLDGWSLDYVISSDASAPFESKRELGALSEFARAIDVIHKNSGAQNVNADVSRPRVRLLSPQTHLKARKMFSKDHRMVDLIVTNLRLLDVGTIRLLTDALPNRMAGVGDTSGFKNLPEYFKVSDESDPIYGGLGSMRMTTDLWADKGFNALLLLIQTDFENCLLTFTQTSTLRARFSREHCHKLYRLGLYLFALEWRQMWNELSIISTNLRTFEEKWDKLVEASQAPLGKEERPSFRAEQEIWNYYFSRTELISDQLSGTIIEGAPRPSFEDGVKVFKNWVEPDREKLERFKEYVGKFFEEMESSYDPEQARIAEEKRKNDFDKYWSAINASLAHKLAHIIHSRRSRQDAHRLRRSMSDEVKGTVYLDPNEEKEVDALTIQLLKSADMDIRGPIRLIEVVVRKLGTDNVHKGISERLAAFEKMIASNTNDPKVYK